MPILHDYIQLLILLLFCTFSYYVVTNAINKFVNMNEPKHIAITINIIEYSSYATPKSPVPINTCNILLLLLCSPFAIHTLIYCIFQIVLVLAIYCLLIILVIYQ